MDILEVLDQVRALLQREGRVSYRLLKRQFALDDEALEDLKFELVEIQELATDRDGKMLVWVGEQPVASSQHPVVSSPAIPTPLSLTPSTQHPTPKPPISYTPAHLADRIRAVTVTDGERKTITALFADLKGSTALIEGLDPEEARTVIDPALQLMMDAVHQYDGFVAQALGDGIFALFGAPLAHEDHPQRALYAALRMQESMRRYSDTLRQQGYPPLLMRVGLNTGEVVLRSIRKDDLHADYVPVGHSTNLAARMEQLATPGSIVVSAYTHRLTEGYFAFKDLGPTQIKGVEEPLHLYEVLGVGQLRTRLQVSATRYGLTRFVGRQHEMEQLQRALEHAKAGEGQIVGTMGEAGLGKSRLFHEFKLTALGGCLVLEAYSVSHGKATAYLSVIELLKDYFGIQSQDEERKRREKVTGKVLNLDRNLEDTLPYLFALLGIEEQPSPLQQMDPQIRRRRTFEALKKLFLRESLNQPLVLIFEDLHWTDSETQGFLDVLSESVASANLLLLTNYRPEYRHEWGQKTYYTQLRLAPLGRAEAEEFLDALLGNVGAGLVPTHSEGTHTGVPLQNLKRLILDKTQGTPFFMEEIVQELREQGVLSDGGAAGRSPLLADLHIPTTVQAVLAARIDRLAPDEKALLQQLAIIGRQFPLSLVRQVITQPEADLYRLLAALQHKEFLYEQPAFPESEYIFKHALTQEVSYGTVLQEQKKGLHERTGQAIEQLYQGQREEHYGELAHHYQRSGNVEKAIEYLQLAGQQAVRESANKEAVTRLTTALDLLRALPESNPRNQTELGVQIALSSALAATLGWSAPAVEQACSRAVELSQRLGKPPELAPPLSALWGSYIQQGKYRRGYQIGEQLFSLALHQNDAALQMRAHHHLGVPLYLFGELVQAQNHFNQGLALYTVEEGYAFDAARSWLDVVTVSNGWAAEIMWILGYADQAQQRLSQTFQRANDLNRPDNQAYARYVAAFVSHAQREVYTVQEHATVITELSYEYGLPMYLAWGKIFQGWALVHQRHGEDGFARMREGFDMFQDMEAEFMLSHYYALLAEAHGKEGRTEEGLQAIAEGLGIVKETEEHFFESELMRLKGELVFQQSPKDSLEAERAFRQSLNIARRQNAKSWELRASTSLARLWRRQGKKEEARQRLAEIYGWFTEGFDTKDLQEAKALLAELDL